MNEVLQALQQALMLNIPITQHMGITVEHYDEKGLTLKAPLAKNVNLRGTAFAGSLSSLATLAGWGQIWLLLKELDIPGDGAIQDSYIDYRRPVTSDFTAFCYKPDQDEISKLEQTLKKRKKARIALEVKIHQGNEVAVELKGRFVVYLSTVPTLSLLSTGSAVPEP